MNILHTADWHIGQTFFDYDRTDEHLVFLDWLKDVIVQTETDLLLISGDIFDNSNPSARSQNLYYSFLRDITTMSPGLQIIIIAGNHDSAARLEAPAPLLEGMNITVRGIVKKDPDGNIDFNNLVIPVLKNGEPKAVCLAVPYLRQGDYPVSENYASGVSEMYRQLFNHVKKNTSYSNLPVIAMGHLQATGSEISENDRWERTIIGGLEAVSPDSFDTEILYTALGHLHKAQKVGKRENVRYAGAPLPMSFSEKKYKQGVNLVSEKGITRIEFTPPAQLVTIPPEPSTLDVIINYLSTLPEGRISINSPYIEIKVLIEGPEPSLRQKIEEALAIKAVKLTRIEAVLNEKGKTAKSISAEQIRDINPLEVAQNYYTAKYSNGEMPPEINKLFIQAMAEALKEGQK